MKYLWSASSIKGQAVRLLTIIVLLSLVLSASACKSDESNSNETDSAEVLTGNTYYYEDLIYDIADENGVKYIVITGVSSEYQTDYDIPSEIDGIEVRKIADYAFSYAPVVNLTLPDTLTEIGYGAFFNCPALVSAKIPSSVKTIGSYAFYACVMLGEVVIPDTVEEIGGLAFYGTPYLEGVTDEFHIVGDGILIHYSGSETEVTLPSGIKCISSAFYLNKQVRNVVISEGVEIIGEGAFFGCSALLTVQLPSTLKSICNSAFRQCELLTLTEADVPSDVEVSEIAFD